MSLLSFDRSTSFQIRSPPNYQNYHRHSPKGNEQLVAYHPYLHLVLHECARRAAALMNPPHRVQLGSIARSRLNACSFKFTETVRRVASHRNKGEKIDT